MSGLDRPDRRPSARFTPSRGPDRSRWARPRHGARCPLPNITSLFETWYPRLVRSIRERVGSADDAEDVVQEAFVRLLAEEPRDSRAWLFTVASRLATDHRRASVRRERFAAGPRWEQMDDPPAAADDALLRDERVASVGRALETLRPRDRDLLMFHQTGMSYRDIAKRLGVARSSVGPLLVRAHRRFVARYTVLYETPTETTNV